MSKEFQLKDEVDAKLLELQYEKPLHLSVANQIIELLAASINALNLEKKKRRSLKAQIFTYLTAGSSPTTYVSGEREGDLKRHKRRGGRKPTHRGPYFP